MNQIPESRLAEIEALNQALGMDVEEQRELVRGYRAATLPPTTFDLEAMLRDTVPGGSICDPQQVADAIREWFATAGQRTEPSPTSDAAAVQWLRAESKEQCARAWRSVVAVLDRVSPDWQTREDKPVDAAVRAIEALATHPPQQGHAVPEGLVLVPRAPTQEMLDRVRSNGGAQAVAWAIAAWPDMLAAACPAEPASQDELGAYNAWFASRQGVSYEGMWEFARDAWMARAGRAATPESAEPVAWQVRRIDKEEGPGMWRESSGDELAAIRRINEQRGGWEIRALFDHPTPAASDGGQAVRETLQWYAEQVGQLRMGDIHAGYARVTLQADGGRRAMDALATPPTGHEATKEPSPAEPITRGTIKVTADGIAIEPSEQLCSMCGRPTMHVGSTCFSCNQRATGQERPSEPVAATAQVTDAEAAVMWDIFYDEAEESGIECMKRVGAWLLALYAPPATPAQVTDAEVEAMCAAVSGHGYGVSSHGDVFRAAGNALLALRATRDAAPDEVLVALKRIEGYEDVHPQILADDAGITWPEWRVVDATPSEGLETGIVHTLQDAYLAGVTDTQRLTWLHENEASLLSSREFFEEDEYRIHWNVVSDLQGKRGGAVTGTSLSGHPLGDPREAIDAAIAAQQKGGGQ